MQGGNNSAGSATPISASSPSAIEKAARELRVFREFIALAGLPIDPTTVENREPPEPDIRCVIDGLGPTGFELVELCNSELAKDIGDQRKRGTPPKFLMLDDPSPAALRSKLRKVYQTDLPIELVCYSGRTAVPDDLSALTLRDVIGSEGTGSFRRIWFLGNRKCEVIADSESGRRPARPLLQMDCEVYANPATAGIWHVVISRPEHPAVIMLPAKARQKAMEADSTGDAELATRLRLAANQADANNNPK
jgi:hypothetical protein